MYVASGKVRNCCSYMLLAGCIIPRVFMVANNVAQRCTPVDVAANVHGCSIKCCQLLEKNVFLFCMSCYFSYAS